MLAFATKAALFVRSTLASAPMLERRGFSGIPMSIGRTLLLFALIPPALAQAPPEGQRLSADSDRMAIDMPNGMRIDLGFSSFSSASLAAHSSVFTSLYWSRAYEERSELETRFGIHPGAGLTLQPYALQQVPVPGHPQFGFVQELRFPVSQSMTGLQFERKDLLFHGDRLSLRSSSDLQALGREFGLFRSGTELDALALLGWRSHSQLVWQLGEPTHEIRWQLSARLDRRAAAQTSTVGFEAMRRF